MIEEEDECSHGSRQTQEIIIRQARELLNLIDSPDEGRELTAALREVAGPSKQKQMMATLVQGVMGTMTTSNHFSGSS